MAEPAYPRPGIIDSDILIDSIRGFAPAMDFIRACNREPDGVVVSSISIMELIVGCSNAAELRRTQKALASVRTLHLSEQSSRQAVEWIAQYRLSHGLAIPDALIAATAFTSGLALYTKNIRHFQMLPSLDVVRPY